jgi:carbon monoxide dehydrogenase subunit G
VVVSTKVEKRIDVDVPVSTAYAQWTRFEEFPHFMGGVESVTGLGDDRLKWKAHIGGVHREWEARIVEQVPDRRVAWVSTEGATNNGSVDFLDSGNGRRTTIILTLEYKPVGVVEKVGDLLHVVARQAEHDLKRFKQYIEHEVPAGTVRPAVPEQHEYTRFGHVFDQTNGLVDFEGESDETAEGENYSAAERKNRHDREDRMLPPNPGSTGGWV